MMMTRYICLTETNRGRYNQVPWGRERNSEEKVASMVDFSLPLLKSKVQFAQCRSSIFAMCHVRKCWFCVCWNLFDSLCILSELVSDFCLLPNKQYFSYSISWWERDTFDVNDVCFVIDQHNFTSLNKK